MRKVWLLIGLVGLLISPHPFAQSQSGGTFSTILGIRPTKEHWSGPITSTPDFFRAEEGKPSTFAFYHWHNCPTARTYSYILLIDNRQVIFEIEGQGLGDFRHRLTVQPNVPLVREFTLPGLSRGLHNLALLAFPKVGECFPVLPGFLPRNSIARVATSVLVGLEEPPEFTVALPAPESFRPGIEKKELPITGIWIGLSPEPVDLKVPGVSLKPSERFDYFIYARNDIFPQLRQWAIVAFIEALQVPINPFRTPMVWYESILLPSGHEITLPASLAAPRDPGVYSLVVMMLGEPYRLTTQETLWMWILTKRDRFELRVEKPE